MALLPVHAAEPLRKRLKLSPEADLVLTQVANPAISQENPSLTNRPSAASSSFTSSPKAHPNSPLDNDIFNIKRYIPVGSLRIKRSESSVPHETWISCNTWLAFAHPRDVYSEGGVFLSNKTQEQLYESRALHPYRTMHNAEWIRLEFKTNDQHAGQVRVYILPDDIGRATINRQQSSLRRAMQLLLSQLDISKATWDGDWAEHASVAHVDSSLDNKIKDDVSLFQLFNTLPSPKPEPEAVTDRYLRDAMYRILDSDIDGLTTTMHPYQRRSAALMLQREAQPSQTIDPRLRPIIDQYGATWYCDVDAGTCLREPRTYESAKGGILAETMGLGKTLICLGLILATRDNSSQIPVEYSVGTIPCGTKRSLFDMAAAAIGRSGIPWKRHFAAMKAEGYDFNRCVKAIEENLGFYHLPSTVPRRESRNPVVLPSRKVWLTTATIVVVPPNLVQQWRHEIKKHTTGLKVLVVNSNKVDLPPAKELAEYDIILFSKPRFDKESKDGSDRQGRRRTTNHSICRCPYIGSTRDRDCTCFKDDEAYRSPLKDLHFKRLVTDEGHTFGNSSGKTEATTVIDFLHLSSRWIVSGTPTQGLYGAEVGLSNASSIFNSPTSDFDAASPKDLSSTLLELPEPSDVSSEESSEGHNHAFYKQERKDLEKLGNIATGYIKARPWSNTHDNQDAASWSQYVMQPRHGSKSRGNMECLRSTLEGMIIRHRPDDVSQDVLLPPLHQSVVYLEGSMQDRISLNVFAFMIAANAVTSERKDKDYLFHPTQRQALQELVSNMRQASFFWSGFTAEMVQSTMDVVKAFLEKGEIHVTAEDEQLLHEAVVVGHNFITNSISQAARKWHEMPIYLENEYPEDIRAAWALDGIPKNPTLMGAGMVERIQDEVQKQLWKEDPMDGLVEAGKKALGNAYHLQYPSPSSRSPKPGGRDSKRKTSDDQAPIWLAGGVSTGDGSSVKKRPRNSSVAILAEDNSASPKSRKEHGGQPDAERSIKEQTTTKQPKSALKMSKMVDVAGTLDAGSPLASAAIVSTSSAKLSYLMDRIIKYHVSDKILVFYEADNVAYYVAQALEFLHVKHLIYAKTLSSERRSQYVVTFNQSKDFRVLLMDVSQAAFGLDLSSASRVYFINPVFSPQVEAQAVKRAHRIGQTKPVFVETLVMKGSVEEVLVERRSNMSTEEHNRCKSILDDRTMNDWIRNVSFLPLPANEGPGPEQMAKLETPQLIFGRGATKTWQHDPDVDLITDALSPVAKSKKGKRAAFVESDTIGMSDKAQGKRMQIFVVPESEEEEVEEEEEELEADERELVAGKALEPTQDLIIGAIERRKRTVLNRHVTFSNSGQYSLASNDGDGEPQPSASRRSSTAFRLQSRSNDQSSTSHSAPFAAKSSSHVQELRLRNEQNIGSPNATLFSLPSSPGPSEQPDACLSDNDEIEYSTPRPSCKRLKKYILGFRMPDGNFKLPPRDDTPPSSTTNYPASPAPSPSASVASMTDVPAPTKLERSRLNCQRLMVKLKLGGATKKAAEIEKASDGWRAEMATDGAKLGMRGWERMDGGPMEVSNEPSAIGKGGGKKKRRVGFVDDVDMIDRDS